MPDRDKPVKAEPDVVDSDDNANTALTADPKTKAQTDVAEVKNYPSSSDANPKPDE